MGAVDYDVNTYNLETALTPAGDINYPYFNYLETYAPSKKICEIDNGGIARRQLSSFSNTFEQKNLLIFFFNLLQKLKTKCCPVPLFNEKYQ